MRAPVKLFGFIFWLFSLNCAQCQECLQKDITYKNIGPVAKASYDDSETVKVNCMTGFTGMYKLKCENGKWKTASERPCAKKKCSHPGDIENGDFKLKEGSEFVFGATVLYSCKKGFEMTSRINQRTCRDQGWDNTLPICEAVKCPAIHTDGGVIASGNTEEGIYDDAIHFKCVSTDKIIDGSSEIHCTETGIWSDPVPTCKDITCTVPEIQNGYVVEKMQEYKKDAILKYGCFKGFKLREGIPRCSKFGWSLKPECDEVTCELKSTTFGVEKSKPEGKTIFRAGESVEITCTGRYWFIFTKESIKSFKCTDNGKWDSDPVCEEIKCEVPHDQYVSKPQWYFSGDMKLGAKKYYSCISDYEKTETEATCTRNGWTPNPLCAIKTCAAPNIANADIVGEQRPKYIIYSTIHYKCRPGFEPKQPVQITCNSKTEWTGIQQCTEMCGAPPNVDFAETTKKKKNEYSSGERVEYSCLETYTLEEPYSKYLTCKQGQWRGNIKCLKVTCELKSTTFGVEKIKPEGRTIFRAGESVEITCTGRYWFFWTKESIKSFKCTDNGKWDSDPVCDEIKCEVPHDRYVSKPQWYFSGDMKLGVKKYYSCISDYEKTETEATCTRNGWTPNPLCAIKTCAAPNIANADIVGEQRPKYIIYSTIHYKCHPGFEPKQPVQITCNSKTEWTGIKQCTEVTCELKSTTFGVEKSKPEGKTIFRAGESVEITCTGRYWFIFTKESIKSFKEIKCEVPHDQYVSKPQWYFSGDMKLGAKKYYSCISDYEKTETEATCTRNGWTPNPLCAIKTCAAPNIANADIVGEQRPKYIIYSTIHYKCRPGFEPKQPVQITCNSKTEWTGIQQCTEMCGAPPNVDFAETTKKKKNAYSSGERVEYSCLETYTLEEPYSKYLTCKQGQWRGNIKCLKPCSVTMEEMNKRGIELQWNGQRDILSPHKDNVSFECQKGKYLKVNGPRQECNDGVMTLPECV